MTTPGSSAPTLPLSCGGSWHLGPELVGVEGLVQAVEGPHVDAVLGSESPPAAVGEDAAGQSGKLGHGSQPSEHGGVVPLSCLDLYREVLTVAGEDEVDLDGGLGGGPVADVVVDALMLVVGSQQA